MQDAPNAPCRSNCVRKACGDGIVDPLAVDPLGKLNRGEQCDDGAQNSATAPNACRPDCKVAAGGGATFSQADAFSLGLLHIK